MCGKLYKKSRGCNWGKCKDCGVIPLLYKLHTGLVVENKKDTGKLKKSILEIALMKIEKKIQTWSFEKILSGEKTFELRLADWKCQPGDTLVLREIDKNRNYTARIIEKKVTYVLKTKDVDLFPREDVEKYGYQIISLK